jgi:diaminopimelate epimerase
MIPFSKMEGCGNDFVVVPVASLDAMPQRPATRQRFVRQLCDRHFGIGADGLLAWEAKRHDGSLQVRMHYWNADGSRAEMCGNGARCVVAHAWEEAGRPATPIQLHTDGGVRPATVECRDGNLVVDIDMGPVTWKPEEIPFEAAEPAVDLPLELPGGVRQVNALAIGNPHAIVFVESRLDWESIDLDHVGRPLSEHHRFPRGANASFVLPESDVLHLRVWERGVGPTLACGTASCAALAAARHTHRWMHDTATVSLPGGRVHVREDAAGHLWLAGPAHHVAHGTLDRQWLTRQTATAS